MILFVDMEHQSGYDAAFGEMILAARARLTYRLQDLTGQICLLQRYSDVDLELIKSLDIQAVFLSGNGTDWGDYSEADQEGLRAVIRSGTVPIFGFCGGFQFIAETLGVSIERIGGIPAGEEDPNPSYAPGWKTEMGYLPVDLQEHALTAGLGDCSVMRQAHSFEIKSVPEGFEILGSSDVTSVQLMTNGDSTIVGTQFHPEYWTDEHPDGERLIRNFCEMASLL